MSATPPDVMGYTRVSTDGQAEKGHSLKEDQPDRIRDYCARMNLHLVDILEDAGECSKTLDRPALQRILAMLRAGEVQGIVVSDLDRLTRYIGDMVHLVETYFLDDRGLRLYSVSQDVDTRSASGRMILYVQTVVNQYQREGTVERTVRTFKGKRTRGEKLGTIPYGFETAEDGKTLVLSDREQVTLAAMLQFRGEGMSLAKIAARLDELGLTARNGNPWATSSVAAILKRFEES